MNLAPPSRQTTIAAPSSATATPRKFPTDPELRAALADFKTSENLTNAKLVKLLGIPKATTDFITRYLNDNLDREAPNFEPLAWDILRSLEQRVRFGSEILVTSVVRRMSEAYNLIRETGDIGLITSPAGNGKTSGNYHYVAENPSSVFVTLNARTRTDIRLESKVFSSIDTKAWDGCSSRFDFLTQRFGESSRLLILDNAHRLDASGLRWIFDFADEANCPIGLSGNDDILKAIMRNDQQFSRVGIAPEYVLTEEETPAAALHTACQFCDPEVAHEIADLITIIGLHQGRLRSVRKTVILAECLRKRSADLMRNPRKAIRAAHARLVRDYTLPTH